MARMDMDWKVGPIFSIKWKCNTCGNHPPKNLWLVFPDEIWLITSWELYRIILCMGKGTMKWLQHRIGLKQHYPRDIAPLRTTTTTLYSLYSWTSLILSLMGQKNWMYSRGGRFTGAGSNVLRDLRAVITNTPYIAFTALFSLINNRNVVTVEPLGTDTSLFRTVSSVPKRTVPTIVTAHIFCACQGSHARRERNAQHAGHEDWFCLL